MKSYRVRDWNQHFENPASRKLKRVNWVAIPNKTDGEGYTALVDHPNGAAHLGAWYAIVEIASKQTPKESRGNLPAGIPADFGGFCRSLSRMSRLPAEIFMEAVPRLVEIGWVEEVLSNQQSAEVSAESAEVLAESANIPSEVGVTGNYKGRELKGTEGNGNGKPCNQFEIDRSAVWIWFRETFSGEIKTEWDLQIFLTVIEGFEDIKLLRDNTPLWCATKKWKDGFGPTAENYLKKRQFLDRPPAPIKTKAEQRAAEWEAVEL